MSENENDEDVNKLNDKYFFIDEEFRTMNESQDDEQTKIPNECKNDLFLQRINKNILENTSGIQNNISNQDNTAISLNKDSLYETFSLFQQFLNTSKVENSNSDGTIDQQKIGEQIQEFLERKRETEKNSKNLNKTIFTEANDKIKKEKKNFFIKTKLIKSVENLNDSNKNKDNMLMNKNRLNTNDNLNDNDNDNIGNNGIKSHKFLINKKLLLTNSKEQYFDNSQNLNNDNEKINFPNINKNENNKAQKTLKDITKSKSNNNIFENEKNNIIQNFKETLEKLEIKNEIKIQKRNSFSKHMKDIIKNKFKKKTMINKGLDITSNRNKQISKDSINGFHSNSCASFFNNTFFDNNLNISPYSLQKNNNNDNKIITYNKNTADNAYRNNVLSSMKKMTDSKSEKKMGCTNLLKEIQLANNFKSTNKNNNLKNNNDNININLNINQEINNINYSSEKPMIDTNYQQLINIKKNLDNQNRNDNISSKCPYNKSLENMPLDTFNSKINNSSNNIVMTEIKVKKKKNISSKEQIIKAKIKELSEETEKFKEERNKITLLKNEYEKLSKQLMKDIEDFRNKKEEFEKYKQNEIEQLKYKKNIAMNQPFFTDNNKLIISLKAQNQTLIQNSKKDKETIKSLKMKIVDLENIIKHKDNEILKFKNANFINSHKELLNNKKKNNNDILKKNKNTKVKKDFCYDLKKLFTKKLTNDNDSTDKKNINNNTISSNFSKVYFDHINKNIEKIKETDIFNNSFYEKGKKKKITKKFSSNNNIIKNGNIKSNINEVNKEIHKDKKFQFNNDINCNPLIERKIRTIENQKKENYNSISNGTQRNFRKISFPKLEINYTKGLNGILDNDININDNNFNTCNAENNSFKVIKTSHNIKKPISQRCNNMILSSNKMKNNNQDFKLQKVKIKKIKTLDNQIRNTINCTEENKDKYILNISNDDKNEKRDSSLNNEKIKKSINTNDDDNFDFIIINNDYVNESEDDNQYDFIIPDKYLSNNYCYLNTIESDGKKINLYTNNKKEILFKSGVKKEIYEDGYQLVHFPNGDMKQTYPNKKQIYYFSDSNTVQTTYMNGLNIFKFENNQIEKHYPDGSKFIIFPNGAKRKITKDGIEEYYISDDENKNL